MTTQDLLASTTQTTSGQSAAIDLGASERFLLQALSVTAVAGTGSPSLDVRFECSPNGVDGWRTFATFARAAAVTQEKLACISPERFVRLGWTIAGTAPSFTFSAKGIRDVVYGTLDDLDSFGIANGGLSSVAPSKRSMALYAATQKANSKLAQRYTLPATAWGLDLVEATCKIAAYDVLSAQRGFNPDGNDANVRTRHNDAWSWLDDVAESRATPVGFVDSSGATTTGDSDIAITTTATRGW